MFLNVRSGSPTEIQYYNDNSLLYTQSAPAAPGGTSFAGVLFPSAVVTRVVITLGDGEIFGFDGSTAMAGGPHRPPISSPATTSCSPSRRRPRPAIGATAGVPISSVLDTFTESDTHAFVAASIDWGDGTRSVGHDRPDVAAARSRSPAAMPTPQAGSYTAEVTVRGLERPSEQTSDTVIEVAPRASSDERGRALPHRSR